MAQKNFFIVAVIFTLLLSFSFLISLVKANYVECRCTFDDKPVIAQGGNLKSCLEMCGKTIGGQIDCEDNCENCCDSGCSKIKEYSSKENCKPSCVKTCKFKRSVFDIISVIYIIAGIVAAVMIVLHGLRMIISKNPRMRETSKKGILYVISALIIIIVAGSLVNLLMKGIIKPTSEMQPIKMVKGCGGKFLNVYHIPVGGDEVEIYVKFMNNGDKICKYTIVAYGGGGKRMGSYKPATTSVPPRGIATFVATISSLDPNLKGEYLIKLFTVKGIVSLDKEIAQYGPVPL